MSNSPISALIFDLDGVLVDTARFHFLSWGKLAHDLDIPFTIEDNERLKGVDRMTSLEVILSLDSRRSKDDTFSKQEKEAFAERKNKLFLKYVNNMTGDDVLPGVLAFLQTMKSQGLKMAVASASKNAHTILSNVALTSFFDIVVDGTQVENSKPDPEIFLKAASLLGVSPSECVVFEDAIAGVKAAKAGMMKVVGIGSPSILTEADWTVTDFCALTIEKISKNLFSL